MSNQIKDLLLSGIQYRDASLRDYQQKAKEQIYSFWNETCNVLYQMPTGTGKTRLFTSIIRDVALAGVRAGRTIRILIIAHRSELIEQISDSLSRYHIFHGILAGNQPSNRDLSLPVQVASIQTLTHPANSQLAKTLGFDFIFIDEAHHCVASSYKKLWKLFPDSFKLGVTATPWRMNGEGFTSLFQTFIPSMQIREFIAKGWLASYDYYSVKANSEERRSIESIKKTGIDGDYLQSELENVFDKDRIRTKLYNSYLTFAKGKRGIIYSISRAHSDHICDKYSCHGVSITSIDSSTPTKERKEKVNAFRRGEIQVLVNVDIFSEGFDCPELEFIQLARPTRSLVKYLQQVGRGLRRNGDKRCVIIDNVGLYQRFGLPDRDRDWRVYFEGIENVEDPTNINRCEGSDTNRGLGEYTREFDLSEGDEKMVKVQTSVSWNNIKEDVPLDNPNEPITAIESLTADEDEDNDASSDKADKPDKAEEEITDSSGNNESKRNQNQIVRSKPVFKKYLIEDEGGRYSIRNIKTGNSQPLIPYRTFPQGEILLEKDKTTNSIMILRRSKPIAKIAPQTIIVGYLKKRGELTLFSAFNSSVTDLVINV